MSALINEDKVTNFLRSHLNKHTHTYTRTYTYIYIERVPKYFANTSRAYWEQYYELLFPNTLSV